MVHTESNKTKVKKRKLKYHEERQKQVKGGGRGHRRKDSEDIYIISNEKSSKHKKRLAFFEKVLFKLLKSFSEVDREVKV